MKTLSATILSLLAIFVALAAPVFAEPPSVLLQEGLYAEEIEGDLDGAIKIYEQVLAEAKDIEQAAAQATYRIGLCHQKKGDKTKAASYFQSILREYPDNEQLVARAKEQLNKLGTPGEVPFGSTAASLYEKLPPEVIQFVGNKYGSICAEAGAKNLYSNSHVYYVTSDFVLLKGGMGYYHNLSDKALFNKIRLCGTSEPNQTHYDIAGRKMNTEIVPDKISSDFYHIYWTPHQPVLAGEMFYYGWCIDQAKQLRPASSPGQYKLTMQNQFGSRVIEAFFLVVPAGTQIVSKTEDYTSKETISGFDVYCFSKEVPEDANHQVDVVLAGPGPAETKTNLYEHLPNEVLTHIGGKYGSISAEAVAKSLYSNSHIYFVASDWVLLKAGMGYYRNGSGQPQTGRIRLSGTSYPNQTLYDIAGREMDIEMVQDKVRQGFYHIYWTPSEPVPPGQMFYYGWCIDDSKQLRPAPGSGHYALEMQNKFGSRVRETFFLVLPKDTEIAGRSEEFSAKDTVGDFDVYYWSKEVPENTNNVVNVTLAGPVFSAPKEVTLPIILHSRADIDLDVGPDKYVAFDFDRGMTFNVERLINKKAPEGGMDLALKSGIDVVAVMAPNSAGLLGVATVFEKLDARTWESVRPGDLSIVAEKQWRIDREQEIPAADAQTSYPVYAFKTAQGGMGIVQLLQIDKVNLTVKFRYAMLRDASQERTSPLPRENSARLLKEIGLAMAMYANEHEDKFPAALEELREFMETAKQGDPQWMMANVTYLAAGKRAGVAQAHLVAAAYDKTLPQQDTGTNVLFLDGHVEFITAGELKRRGIAAIDAAPPSAPGVERDVARPRAPVTPAEE